MIYGYGLIYKGRIALQAQKAAILEEGALQEEMRYDDLSGLHRPLMTTETVPERQMLIEKMRSGDVIVVQHAACLGISLADGVQALADILKKNGALIVRHGFKTESVRLDAQERELLDNFSLFVRLYRLPPKKGEEESDWRFSPRRALPVEGSKEYEKIAAIWHSRLSTREAVEAIGLPRSSIYRLWGGRRSEGAGG